MEVDSEQHGVDKVPASAAGVTSPDKRSRAPTNHELSDSVAANNERPGAGKVPANFGATADASEAGRPETPAHGTAVLQSLEGSPTIPYLELAGSTITAAAWPT